MSESQKYLNIFKSLVDSINGFHEEWSEAKDRDLVLAKQIIEKQREGIEFYGKRLTYRIDKWGNIPSDLELDDFGNQARQIKAETDPMIKELFQQKESDNE